MKLSEAKRIFSCFVITLIAIFFLCGCSTIKWKWVPEDSNSPTRLTQGEKERGAVKIDVLKVSF
jgi:hypothetical protein